MPRTLESKDYDLFDFRHFDEKTLNLQEAMQELQQRRALRRRDILYRLVPVDSEAQRFRVEEVSLYKATEELRLRVSNNWSRLVSRFRTLNGK